MACQCVSHVLLVSSPTPLILHFIVTDRDLSEELGKGIISVTFIVIIVCRTVVAEVGEI